MTTFTASEVRATAHKWPNWRGGEMLHAYAVRLEADEKAQAQPPVASVTDEMVERARSAFVQADDGSTGLTDAIRAALLAAQEGHNEP